MGISDASRSHVVILRANRLEALVPELARQLQTDLPGNVLAAQTVVTAHAAMKSWLVAELARTAGPDGIVANLDVVLPSAWLEQVARDLLGAAGTTDPRWRSENLRWVIDAALREPTAIAGLDVARIAHYLPADAAAPTDLRRFQLAERLARIYAQYLAYRPDWLDAWEHGKFAFAAANIEGGALPHVESGLLAPLWRHVAGRTGNHRARAAAGLTAHLRAGDLELPGLHVFGLSHLPPSEMEVLHAWSRHAPVFMYLPDPCREYWIGIDKPDAHAPLRAWHLAEQARIDAAGDDDWLDDAQAHPLLARWGRLGQHFHALLAQWNVTGDVRHVQDAVDVKPHDRLSRLQESIRRLEVGLLRGDHEQRADASLRVHACHTRLRELEVLRDALLDAIAAGIQPGQIVVVAPDIAAYAPLLPAVFGPPADPRERILPWQQADVPLRTNHGLFNTFANLLDSGSSRITANEVIDLLAAPEVARALALEDGARDALSGWLRESRAAWGLDAGHRHALGLPAIATHTLAWGLDRMLAGYVLADTGDAKQTPAFTLPDGCMLLPLAGARGPDAAALGALDRLLCELQRWRELSSQTLAASQWSTRLQERCDALLRIDRTDKAARNANQRLAEIIAGIGGEAHAAGVDAPLHFSVVRELLHSQLDAEAERQRYLMGAVTFAGMVRQRGIPFAMVCVLGLDDGQLPRARSDGGIDLMARLHRIGDRDIRSDDRWMFLEAVMSARQRLHLSFIGQGERDGKPRNPAAPLAELLSVLDQAHAIDPGDAKAPRPWRVQHRLQPFDASYFDGKDAGLFSYVDAFARLRRNPSVARAPFVGGDPLSPDPLPATLSLSSLRKFWKYPAQNLLKQRLRMDFSVLDDGTLPDDEPLDAQLPKVETVARKVFFDAALPLGFAADGEPRWKPSAVPAWVEFGGLLPPGELGRSAWQGEANGVLALLDAVKSHGCAASRGCTIAVDIALPADKNLPTALRLQGQIEHVFELPGRLGWQLLRAFPTAADDPADALKDAKALNFGDRLGLFIEWAALRLHTAEAPDPPAVRLTVLAGGADLPMLANLLVWDEHFVRHWDERTDGCAVLRERLSRIVALWWQAGGQPPLYFPRTSQAVCQPDATAPDKNASSAKPKPDAWKVATEAFEDGPNDSVGERNYDTATATLMRGRGFNRQQYADGQAATNQLRHYALELEGLMILPVRGADAEIADV
ncbi:MAG: exodeoxyribonuclease V subunit gamma [Proteobacteria bacterium]|nr:exodeoxyribonuclease V subunit gamma [Pseudomonadota bacterium]